jgi:hypothetical protein
VLLLLLLLLLLLPPGCTSRGGGLLLLRVLTMPPWLFHTSWQRPSLASRQLSSVTSAT